MRRFRRQVLKMSDKRNKVRLSAVVLAVAALMHTGMALALPVAPQVINGQVGFAQNGSVLTMTNSPNAIIHWVGFSIAAGETVRFAQQSALSSVLNRVIGSDPSTIYGALQSNGRVFLINQNGILIGPGAQINVNGFVASSLDILDGDFLAGRMKFSAGPVAGKVENQGTITTPSGGFVYLIAPEVVNSGVIRAPNGDVLLAAGKEVQLIDAATPEIAYVVSAPEHQAVNLGEIVADAGRIGLYGGIVRQAGRISADSAVQDASGRIFLKATTQLTMEAGSRTSADGIGNANGGTIYALSGGLTTVLGQISAKGGDTGGDGGFIETSGRQVDVWSASVSTAAPKGRTGLWLIDPEDIIISAAYAPNITSALNSTNLTISTSACNPSYGNCTASGGGTITVSTPLTWSSGNKLTLQANVDINMNDSVSATGNGSLDLIAGGSVLFSNGALPTTISLGSGSLNVFAQSNISTGTSPYSTSITAGNIMFNAVSGGILNGTGSSLQTVGNGSIVMTAGGVVSNYGSINAGSGFVYLRGTGIDFQTSSVTTGGIIRAEATTSSGVMFAGGTVGNSATQSIEFSSDVLTVSGGGTSIQTSTASIQNDVHYAPYSGTSISLSSYLPTALLSNTTAPTLVIGREAGTGGGVATGNVTVSSLIWSGGQRIGLLSGGSISGGGVQVQSLGVIAGGSVNLSGNMVDNLAIRAGGAVTFGNNKGFNVVTAVGGLMNPTIISGVTSSGANISLSGSSGDIFLAGPVNAGPGSVTINSGGGIYTGTGGLLVADIMGGSLSLNAGTNIGGPVYALKTQTPLWSALTAGGSMYIDNFGAVSTATTLIKAGDVASLSAHSPLTIGDGGLTAGGNIYLTAAKSYFGLLPDDLTINGPVTSLNGSIYLKAGGKILGSGQLSAAGLIYKEEGGTEVPASLLPLPPMPPLYADPAGSGLVLVASSSDSAGGTEENNDKKDKDKNTGNGADSKPKEEKGDGKSKKNFCN